MNAYIEFIINYYQNYFDYLIKEISLKANPWFINYFWWLILISFFIWFIEILFPWRRNQSLIRKDFFLDAFYMFFNSFIFNLIFLFAFSKILNILFMRLMGEDISKLAIINIKAYPQFLQLIIFFIALDFLQWITHILLHRLKILWNFHKVHHSVLEMGFAAHLRFHWMENIIYSPIKYIGLILIGGATPEQAFIVHYTTIAIGHLNHSNINISYGPLKFIFNNPVMHIWHHSLALPNNHKYGMNFGISLSIWDYIFKTVYIPYNGRDITLGFKNVDIFPKTFVSQSIYPLNKKERSDISVPL